MNVQPGKAARRRRKPPQRRVPAVVEQRERKPFIFGWGAHLTQREREALKERIALFAGIAIAAVVAIIIAWGVIKDNVIDPAQQRAADNKPITVVGTGANQYVIRTGFFKKFEIFENNNLQSQLATAQSQQSQLNANPKKNAAALAQISQQIQQLQAQQTNLATDALNTLVTDDIVIRRGFTAGVPADARARKVSLNQGITQFGGPLHFKQFVEQSGLTTDQVKMLLLGDYLQGKIEPKLIAKVSHVQLEVRASHILLPAKKHAEALRLLQQVKHGANFAALAKKYSTDKSSAVKGGDLGFFARGTMTKPFETAAFAMKVGEIRLVKSSFGWHIIKVTGRARKKLSATDYQNATASAFTSWLNQQKAIVRVQNLISVNSLAPVVTPSAATQPTLQLPAVTPQTIPTSVAPHPTAATQGTQTTVKPSGKVATPAKKP